MSACPSCKQPLDASGRCRACGAATIADDFDDPTARIGVDELDDPSIDISVALPERTTIYTRTRDDVVQGLVGVERRFAELADGRTTLAQIAPAVGVNVLRAQHIADALQQRGLIKEAFLPDGISSLPDLDE